VPFKLFQTKVDGTWLQEIIMVIFLEGGCGNLKSGKSNSSWSAGSSVQFGKSYQLWMTRIILETDATELVRGLTLVELDQSVDGSLFKQIKDLIRASFDYCSIRHCPRNYNKVADCLAVYGASVVSSRSTAFMSQIPSFFTSFVSENLLGARI
jgi:hypothetical protein